MALAVITLVTGTVDGIGAHATGIGKGDVIETEMIETETNETETNETEMIETETIETDTIETEMNVTETNETEMNVTETTEAETETERPTEEIMARMREMREREVRECEVSEDEAGTGREKMTRMETDTDPGKERVKWRTEVLNEERGSENQNEADLNVIGALFSLSVTVSVPRDQGARIVSIVNVTDSGGIKAKTTVQVNRKM